MASKTELLRRLRDHLKESQGGELAGDGKPKPAPASGLDLEAIVENDLPNRGIAHNGKPLDLSRLTDDYYVGQNMELVAKFYSRRNSLQLELDENARREATLNEMRARQERQQERERAEKVQAALQEKASLEAERASWQRD